MLFALGLMLVATAEMAGEAKTVKPVKLSELDAAGGIFESSATERKTHEDGNVTLDATSLLSSDKKFASGMYRSGKTHEEITEPYGADEFMYFLEGSVRLTSRDGTKQMIRAGEGVSDLWASSRYVPAASCPSILR